MGTRDGRQEKGKQKIEGKGGKKNGKRVGRVKRVKEKGENGEDVRKGGGRKGRAKGKEEREA